ncbi:hypothetical protein [Actinosynnema sp. NPDC020468]
MRALLVGFALSAALVVAVLATGTDPGPAPTADSPNHVVSGTVLQGTIKR